MNRFAPLFFLASLACTGEDPIINQLYPELTISPLEYDFGEVVVDYTETVTFEVINTGRAPLDISSITFADGGLGVYTVEPVEILDLPWRDDEDQNRAEITVSFTPSTYLGYIDMLLLETNEEGNPTTEIPITGLGGDGPTPDIDLDSLTVDFGEVIPPQSSVVAVEIRNVGDGPLTIDRTEQHESGDFIIPFSLGGTVIAPGNSYPL
ncbi:MAG: choice-of-anchor D domain-containing protein, partial [Alphaproteobacteria bacterium]|nr:choice-of-anchor D domain-containing protein [Alphaproteobacteria bacterium]